MVYTLVYHQWTLCVLGVDTCTWHIKLVFFTSAPALFESLLLSLVSCSADWRYFVCTISLLLFTIIYTELSQHKKLKILLKGVGQMARYNHVAIQDQAWWAVSEMYQWSIMFSGCNFSSEDRPDLGESTCIVRGLKKGREQSKRGKIN